MGTDAVDRAIEVARLESRTSQTEELKLHGWSDEILDGPFASHGSDGIELERLVAARPAWGQPIHPKLPGLIVQVIWAARRELARSVEDVLARRTRGLFLDARASIEAAPAVASLLASELGRDKGWESSEIESFRKLAEGYLPKS